MRDGGVGLALGLILGLGVALLRQALDRTYTDPDRLESDVNVTVLGTVPRSCRRKAAHDHQARQRRAEAYRQVRTNIEFAGPPTR